MRPMGEGKKAKIKKHAGELEAEAVADAKVVTKKKKKKNSNVAGEGGAAETDLPKNKKRKAEATADSGSGGDVSPPARKKKREHDGVAKRVSVKADTPEEAARRIAQRDMQQLVLKLRAEGKAKWEIDAAKRDLKHSIGTVPNPDSAKEKKKAKWLEWKESDAGQKEVKDHSERKHDIVVVPISWRGRTDKLDVEKTAEDIKAVLAQQGLDVWIDSRRHYKPGQKFAHWEFRGVMTRVEVGPEDLLAGVCRVCQAKTPGDFQTVVKRKVRLPPAGSRALLLAVKEFGFDKIEIERREGDSDDEGEQMSAEPAAAPAVEDELEGNYQPHVSAAEKERKKKEERKKKKKGG